MQLPTWTPKIKNAIDSRRWNLLKAAWLNHIPTFAYPGAKPDPGLEHLATLDQVELPETKARFADVPGLRSNLLAEAVFMFHKCAHAHLAAQRLGSSGMHSWGLFNAYHAAYIGARGVMALLGIGLPYLDQRGQLLIDIYPQPESLNARQKKELAAGHWKYEEFVIVRFPRHLDHRQLWEMFQRVIGVSDISCCDARIAEELLSVPFDSITTPRNGFLYKAAFWPSTDLLADGDESALFGMIGMGLNAEQQGFLLRLSCDVYRIFEQLLGDLAEQSVAIRSQLDQSRIISNPTVAELACYNTFLAQVGGAGTPG
jgi:hypothetical protein